MNDTDFRPFPITDCWTLQDTTSDIDHVIFQKYTEGILPESASRELDHVQCDWDKLTHQSRIITKTNKSKSVPTDGCPDLLRTSSGMLNHINTLSRVESFLSHLAWENIAHICRHESMVVFIAKVDDRVARTPRGSIFCILSESSHGKLIQGRPTHFGPVLYNGVCPVVDLMIEAYSSGPSVRMRKPEDGPHRLLMPIFQVKGFDS